MPLKVLGPQVPAAVDPANASVFDSPWQTAARWIVGKLGIDKPATQVLAPLAPLETGPVGGLVGKAGELISGVTQGLKAYHGSPHDFERFSLSHVGTGEGAQAYGHGLYFAENPDVAAHYRSKLSGVPRVLV